MYIHAKITNTTTFSSQADKVKISFLASLTVATLNTILLYPLDVVHCLMSADMSMGTGVIEDEGTFQAKKDS